MLKSVLTVYQEEINFLLELETWCVPCFLRRFVSQVDRYDGEEDDIKNMTGLMEAF